MSSEKDSVDEVLDLLRVVFNAQMECLVDHARFKEIGEGKIKMFVKPTTADPNDN